MKSKIVCLSTSQINSEGLWFETSERKGEYVDSKNLQGILSGQQPELLILAMPDGEKLAYAFCTNGTKMVVTFDFGWYMANPSTSFLASKYI
jgi:hypothetical protein